jgi:hypothetical protein
MSKLDRTDAPAATEYATMHVVFELSKKTWKIGVMWRRHRAAPRRRHARTCGEGSIRVDIQELYFLELTTMARSARRWRTKIAAGEAYGE